MLRRTTSGRQTIEDPALASWLFDASWVAEQGPWARTFSIWRPEEPPARAWFVRESDVDGRSRSRRLVGRSPRHPCVSSRQPSRSSTESRKPEEWTIWVEASEPGWVIVSQLADPQWKARWINAGSALGQRRADPARVSQKGRARGLAVHRGPRGRATGLYAWNMTRKTPPIGMGISIIAWAGWLIGSATDGLCAAGASRLVPVDATRRRA